MPKYALQMRWSAPRNRPSVHNLRPAGWPLDAVRGVVRGTVCRTSGRAAAKDRIGSEVTVSGALSEQLCSDLQAVLA